MKSYRKELWFNTKHRREFINITPDVEECLAESGVKEGLLLCNAMHITASVFINDDESGLHQDFETLLEKYHHVKVKRRWIFQCLKDMADEGLITRRKRYSLNGEAKIEQLPGIITFTLKGLKYLVAKKVAGAYKALKDMMAWVKGKDRRFPERKDIAPDMTDAEIEENLGRLRNLIDEIV